MRDFSNTIYNEVLNQINTCEKVLINIQVSDEDFTLLPYFLVKNSFYPVVIDDYPYQILDKESLLEALYYQLKLITVYDLNWDAIQEGFSDLKNNLSNYDGICLLFRKGNELINILPNEMKTLEELLADINAHHKRKAFLIIMNKLA